MKTELVVFAMAGTTIADNGNVNKAFQRAFAKKGIEVPEQEFDRLMGYYKGEAIRLMLEKYHTGSAEEKDGLLHCIFRRFTYYLMESYENDNQVKPLPFAAETFARLQQQGVKVALNTGFPRDVADIILQKTGWANSPLIDAVICSDEVAAGRPYPYMIHTLMERLSIANSAAVAKCGDTPVDIKEGRNAGCGLVAGITTGAFSGAALLSSHPDVIIDSLEQFPALLTTHSGFALPLRNRVGTVA